MNPEEDVCSIEIEGSEISGKSGDMKEQNACSSMREISRYLEERLLEWQGVVTLQRMHHYYLNFYTMDQIIVLQEELIKIKRNQPIDAKAMNLLCLVNPNCSEDKLFRAFQACKDRLGRSKSYNSQTFEK
jgi:hypothetical protein